MNVLNQITGEILDLKILWKAPKTRKRTSYKRYGYKKTQENNWMIVALCALLATTVLLAGGAL